MTNPIKPQHDDDYYREISDIQIEHLARDRDKRRWVLVEEPDGGYKVTEFGPLDVSPSTNYITREAAAARLLQLLGVASPVTPQNWPERIRIGEITTAHPETEGQEPRG